jgi:hypothetical protein
MAREVQRNLQMAQPEQSAGSKRTWPRNPWLIAGRAGNSKVREPPQRFFHNMVSMFMI